MTSHVLRADARCLPLADDSVDLIVTSPPYFALRSYTDGGEHYDGQVGAEATPAEFVDALLEVTRECVRALKPSGSLWVNLGDKYAGGGGQWDKDDRPDPSKRRAASGSISSGGKTYGLRAKSLIGIPWRYALRCIDELGLILRAEVIWSKPNGLPESVTDRVRRSHEQWFHFTVEPRYFSAVDAIREPHVYPDDTRHLRGGRRSINPDGSDAGGNTSTCNPLGKLPGSVWTVPTEPLIVPDELGVDHFAAFPTAWPKRIIEGWSPAGICVACGEGRRPVVERGSQPAEPAHRGANRLAPGKAGNGTLGFRASKLSGQEWNAHRAANPDRITGEACACPEPTAATRPAVVLDPFGGTGTTAMVARALGRVGISVDLSADYCRLAQWRTNDGAQLAKVRGEEFRKPAPQIDGQAELFGEGVA